MAYLSNTHINTVHMGKIACAPACLPACFVLLAYSPGLTRFYLQEVQADWVPHIRFGDVRNGQQQGSTQAPITATVCDHANELSKRFKRQTPPVIMMTIRHISVTAERSDKNSLILFNVVFLSTSRFLFAFF